MFSFELTKLGIPDFYQNPQERKDAFKRILKTAQLDLVEKIGKKTGILTELSRIRITNSIQHKEELKILSQKFLKLIWLTCLI